MEIPSNLKSKEVSKAQCIRIIRSMERAIRDECFECVQARSIRRTRVCPGARLPSSGERCPLYDFRPK